MPRLTPADKIRERLKSFDVRYLGELYRLSRYMYGDTDALKGGWTEPQLGDDGFPIFGDIQLKGRRIGQSRRILNSALLCLSKYMSSEPAPQFPQVDRTTAELRKQVFLKRYHDGSWSSELQAAFLDGDNLGIGVVAFGAKRGPDGQQLVHAEHVPATQVIWDPLEASLGRSTWVGLVHYVAPEKAIAIWGKEKVQEHIRTHFDLSGQTKTRFVRVTEYYDLGFGHGYAKDDLPTYAVFVGGWSGQPVVRTTNPYPVLPVAWYEYITPPGVRRPMGKIELQIATAEAINEVEREIRRAVRGAVGFDVVDPGQLNQQDLERVRRGESNVLVRLENAVEGRSPVQRILNRDFNGGLLQQLAVLERQYNADSQSTELQRGSVLTTTRSATETSLLASSAESQGIYSQRATLKFYERVVERALAVAAVIDRSPMEVDVYGHNVLVNDPSDPRMALDGILSEPSTVLISPQSLQATDVMRDQQLELQRLSYVQPYVGIPGGIPLSWYLDRLLRAIGEEDPSDVLGDPAEAEQAALQAQTAALGNATSAPESQPYNLENQTTGMATGGLSQLMA